MTVEKILTEVRPLKPMSRETLYVCLRRFKIKPLGVRQRPQQYPEDTPSRILAKLGLVKPNGKARR